MAERKSYIIVKYAEEYWPDGKAPLEASVAGSYSARACGIVQATYDTRKEAEPDLVKLKNFNPAVFYGIVELEAAQ